MTNLKLSHLKPQLIQLGSENPKLRVHLAAILTTLERHEAPSQEDLFGEIRSAIQENNGVKVRQACLRMIKFYGRYYNNVVRPYLNQAMLRTIQNAKVDDLLQLTYMKSTVKPHRVLITHSYRELKAKGNNVELTMAIGRKPRSKKEGGFRSYDGVISYQATLLSYYEDVIWIEKK